MNLLCAFWTSCCPHHLSDGGASSPCVSSQSGDGLSSHLLPQSAGHTWNFWKNYGNLQEVSKVRAEMSEKNAMESGTRGAQ